MSPTEALPYEVIEQRRADLEARLLGPGRERFRDCARVYADGGVLHKNPSPVGGTWAYVLLDGGGTVLEEAVGLVVPGLTGSHPRPPAVDGVGVHVGAWPGDVVTNNQTETLALVNAIAVLPDGWAGVLCTDSEVAHGRVLWGWNLTGGHGLPPAVIQHLYRQRARLGRMTGQLLAGHPSRAELRAGQKVKLNRRTNKMQPFPVSKWNVRCDTLCDLAADAYLTLLEEGAP